MALGCMNTTSRSFPIRRNHLVLACSLGLALMLPGLASAESTETWRDFARHSLTPDYSWNQAPSGAERAPDVRTLAGLAAHRHGVSLTLGSERARVQRSLTLALDQVAGSGAAGTALHATVAPDLMQQLSPLHNRLMGASYEQEIGARGRFGVAALVSQQQYATPGFGVLSGVMPNTVGNSPLVPGESVNGHGVRLDYRLPMSDRLAWQWTAQSRLEMNALESVHGVFAEPGDFDLPARLGAQVQWQAQRDFRLLLGVERVYYGEITPFTSPALPARLLSLMADGSAPDFAWRDLTVYSAETRWADRWQGEWSLRYSTRQQPSPTAALYRRALDSEYTNTNLTFGYRRALLRAGELQLTASYAPSMAFLGPGPAFASHTYARGSIAEFEAVWLMRF